MKRFIMPRGTGKTEALIKESSRTGAVIVCSTSSTVGNISERAARMNMVIETPVTFDEFLNGRHGRNVKNGFLIDELDIFLRRFKVVGYSYSDVN